MLVGGYGTDAEGVDGDVWVKGVSKEDGSGDSPLLYIMIYRYERRRESKPCKVIVFRRRGRICRRMCRRKV